MNHYTQFIIGVIYIVSNAIINSNQISVKRESFDNCITNSAKFWRMSGLHFAIAKTVTITIIHEGDRRLELKEFLDKSLKQYFQIVDGMMAIRTRELVLIRYTKPQNRIKFTIHEGRDNEPKKSDNISLEETVRIKRLSSNSPEGHVIIAWSAEILHKFLDQDPESVIPRARSTYLVLFVNPRRPDCAHLRTETGQVLIRMWLQFAVFDAISQSPCSCDTRIVYIHRPVFRFAPNSWGAVFNYTIDDILEHTKLITNSIENFNEYPLTISLFERSPTAIRKLPKILENGVYRSRLQLRRSGGFGGQDGVILAAIARCLNFSVKIDDYEGNFGRVLENGTVTGSLEKVVNRKVAFSANGRFLMDYKTKQIEFTSPYGSDEVCILTPKARRIPQWATLFHAFDHPTWILIFLTVIATTSFWYFWGQIPYEISTGSHIQYSWWEMFSILMGIPVNLRPESYLQIAFIATCLFFSVIILGIIQGSFFTAFTTVSYYRDLDTLEELDDSGYKIHSAIFGEIIKKEGSSGLMRSLEKKIILDTNRSLSLAEVAKDRKYATIERKRDVQFEIRMNYVQEDGFPLLHVVNECLTSFFIAYIVPEGSPLLTVLNHVLVQLIESGLTDKWYRDVVDAMSLEKKISFRSRRDVDTPFSTEDIQVAFHLWIIGLSAAFVAFLSEIASRKCADIGNGAALTAD